MLHTGTPAGLPLIPKSCFTVPVLPCFAEKNAIWHTFEGRGKQFTLSLCNKDELLTLQAGCPSSVGKDSHQVPHPSPQLFLNPLAIG